MRLACAIMLLVLSAPIAWAHSKLRNLVVSFDGSEARISMEFSSPLEFAFSRFVAEPENEGGSIPLPLPEGQKHSKFIELKSPHVKPGNYLLRWTILSVDGHRQEGQQKITVRQNGKPPH